MAEDQRPPPAWWSGRRASLGASAPTIVPLWRELLCDGDTPVSAYARLRAAVRGGALGPVDAPTFLLESVGGGERWSRYSVVGVGCRAHLQGRVDGDGLAITVTPGPGFALPPGVPRESRGLVAVEGMLAALRGAYDGDAPRFWGGLLGVWGHDIVRCFESLGPRPDGPAPTVADLELIATDTLLVFDNFSQRVRVCATARPGVAGDGEDEARARIDAVIAALGAAPSGLAPRPYQPRPRAVDPEVEHPRYREAVARAREHIMAGDIFQVVLAQPFRRPSAGLDPLAAYRMLRVDNPAPYMYLLELPSGQLAGASPEVLVRVDGGPSRTVTVRPLAGTRRRGATPEEDAALERELLADPKERAEHLMLIDLGRNDVGRVAEPGSVEVTRSFEVERYSRVMHIVSEVCGRLRPELSALDALRAAFPAGTLSGAPKVRALEIIDALEGEPRGWYGGAVGYLGYDGAADFAICIRSLVIAGGEVHIKAGAGIVHDSDPGAEDRECQAKASAVLRAVDMAQETDTTEEAAR